jgi:hypothetical protein
MRYYNLFNFSPITSEVNFKDYEISRLNKGGYFDSALNMYISGYHVFLSIEDVKYAMVPNSREVIFEFTIPKGTHCFIGNFGRIKCIAAEKLINPRRIH